MSKATPIRANPAKKRTHDEREEDYPSDDEDLSSKTPRNSPTKPMVLPENPPETVGEAIHILLDKGKGRATAKPQTDGSLPEQQIKKVRLQVEDEILSPIADVDGSNDRRSGTRVSQLDASESNDYWTGDTSSDMAGVSAGMQNPDGTWPGRSSQDQNLCFPSHPSAPQISCSPTDSSQASEHGDATAAGDQMDID